MERLSGLDATFLYLETPSLHMHVAMTMVIDPSTMDGGYSFERIKEFIRTRAHLVPPFHRRVVSVPFNLAHPVWVDDPEFDIDYHVRRIGAPAPGGRRELADLAGQIASTQLDRSRPLWELWVIEGLKQGRVGVVTKIHHCAIDGTSGADLMVHLFDLDPAGRELEPHTPIAVERIPSDASCSAMRPPHGGVAPSACQRCSARLVGRSPTWRGAAGIPTKWWARPRSPPLPRRSTVPSRPIAKWPSPGCRWRM